MKNLLLAILLLTFSQAFAQEDFTVIINGKPMKVALDKTYETMVEGKKVTLSVTANDTLTYSDNIFSFKYPKGLNITRTTLEGNIEQIMIMTALGSGVLIQRYPNIDPSMITEMMLTEVTKESVSYGYTMKREDYKKNLGSGSSLNIKKAVLDYKGDTNIYEITSISKKDEGVLILTMNTGATGDKQGQDLISLLWKTINVK